MVITASHASRKDEEVLQGSLLGFSLFCAPSALSVVLCLQEKKWIAGASDRFLQQALCYVSILSRPVLALWGKACRAGFAVPACKSTLPEPRIPAARSFALDRSQTNVLGVPGPRLVGGYWVAWNSAAWENKLVWKTRVFPCPAAMGSAGRRLLSVESELGNH